MSEISRMPIQTSVVITCFNKEQAIGACLDSVLSQGFDGLEIVVVDDASSDKSLEIIKSYGDALTVVENPTNLGALGSLASGVEKASGTQIITLDGDDRFAPDALKAIVSGLGEQSGVALYTALVRVPLADLHGYNAAKRVAKSRARFVPARNIFRYAQTGTSAFAFFRSDFMKIVDDLPPVLIQDHILPCMLARVIREIRYHDTLTHIAVNWEDGGHITDQRAQLEHDRIGFFWQCAETERLVGSTLFEFFFRFILLKKILKRNRRFELGIETGPRELLACFGNRAKLQSLKDLALAEFRRCHKIKFYGSDLAEYS